MELIPRKYKLDRPLVILVESSGVYRLTLLALYFIQYFVIGLHY